MSEQATPWWSGKIPTDGDGYPTGHVKKRDLRRLLNEHSELLSASMALRQAQRNYMANRGNDEYGRKVAQSAIVLDRAIAKATTPDTEADKGNTDAK